MPQEHGPHLSRQAGLQTRRGGNGGGKRRALHGTLHNDACNRVRSIPAADHRQRVKGGHLLRYRPIAAKASEAPAQAFEGRHRRSEPTPSRFVRERRAISEASIGDRGQERVIIEFGRHRSRRRCRWLRLLIQRNTGDGKEIELLARHLRGLGLSALVRRLRDDRPLRTGLTDQPLVEGIQRLGFGTRGHVQRINDIDAAFGVAESLRNPLGILDDHVGQSCKLPERLGDLGAREFIGALEHPGRFQQHRLGDEDRLGMGEQGRCAVPLREIVADQQAHQDVRIDGDHRAFSLSPARCHALIAWSISSIVLAAPE